MVDFKADEQKYEKEFEQKGEQEAEGYIKKRFGKGQKQPGQQNQSQTPQQ